MGRFCDNCGSSIGFLSRKKLIDPETRPLEVCKTCAASLQREWSGATAPEQESEASAKERVKNARHSFFQAQSVTADPGPASVTADPKPASASDYAEHMANQTVGSVEERIVALLIRRFREETEIDISSDDTAMSRVREAALKAAVELKTESRVEVNLPFLTADASGPKHLQTAFGVSNL